MSPLDRKWEDLRQWLKAKAGESDWAIRAADALSDMDAANVARARHFQCMDALAVMERLDAQKASKKR